MNAINGLLEPTCFRYGPCSYSDERDKNGFRAEVPDNFSDHCRYRICVNKPPPSSLFASSSTYCSEPRTPLPFIVIAGHRDRIHQPSVGVSPPSPKITRRKSTMILEIGFTEKV